MRTRRRITKAVFQNNEHQFTLTFQPDGLHIREKFARDERVLSFAELVGLAPTKKSSGKANAAYPAGSAAETVDVAACDLNLLADAIHQKKQHSPDGLKQIRESVLKALKIVRSLEALA